MENGDFHVKTAWKTVISTSNSLENGDFPVKPHRKRCISMTKTVYFHDQMVYFHDQNGVFFLCPMVGFGLFSPYVPWWVLCLFP